MFHDTINDHKNVLQVAASKLSRRRSHHELHRIQASVTDVADMANSLDRLSWSNHGNRHKHKEPQSVGTGGKKHTKKYRV
jgi:hypothetical protein